jgi:hypothetical protein
MLLDVEQGLMRERQGAQASVVDAVEARRDVHVHLRRQQFADDGPGLGRRQRGGAHDRAGRAAGGDPVRGVGVPAEARRPVALVGLVQLGPEVADDAEAGLGEVPQGAAQ